MSTKASYSFSGLFIGLLIGCLAGIGELNYVKKNQRSYGFPILLIGGGIAGAAIGISVGYKYGLCRHIKEVTGIEAAETMFLKQGRYWIATTVWRDTRTQISSQVVTGKSNNKILITELDERPIVIHETTSASKVTVEKYHNQIVQSVFSTLAKSFVEDVPSNLKALFPTISTV